MTDLERYLYNKKLDKILRLEESAEKLNNWNFERIRSEGPNNGYEINLLTRINFLLKLYFLVGEKIKVDDEEYYVEDVEDENLGSVFVKLISTGNSKSLGGKRIFYRELKQYTKNIDWNKLEDFKVEENIRIPFQPTQYL